MYQYIGTVTRVVDADTLEVSLDLGFEVYHSNRLRLFGINASEKNTIKGQDAIKFVDEFLKGKQVVIETIKDKKEKYGRYLANVFVVQEDGSKVNLNEALLEAGFALPYDGQGPRPIPQ